MDQINQQLFSLEQQKGQLITNCLTKNEFLYEKDLGEGQFSKVIQAKSLKDQSKVAIKIFKNDQNQQFNFELFKQEVQILEMIQNEKQVIQFIKKIEDQQSGVFAIVTELCDCNLTHIMEYNKFSIEQVIALSYQLLRGLILFQMRGIMHTDIKPDNILYSKSKNSFVISDFGLSKLIKNPSLEKTISSLEGNLNYKAPEVINNQKPYTFATAIYSIGIIILEVFIQRRLDGMEYLNLKSRSLLSVFPELQNSKHNEFINQILSKMVEPDKSQRLESLQIIQLLNQFQIYEESLNSIKFSEEDTFFYNQKSKTQFIDNSNFLIKFILYQIPNFIKLKQIMETKKKFKINLISYGVVGKTCILDRIKYNQFITRTATIGADFFIKEFQLKDGQNISLQIWDSSGQEQFRKNCSVFLRGSSGFVCVFNTTDKQSFEKLKQNLPKYQEFGVPILMLGTKIDLPQIEEVDKQLAIDCASKNNLALAFCSAKTGENIQESFTNLAEEIWRRHILQYYSQISSQEQLSNSQSLQKPKNDIKLQKKKTQINQKCL